MKGKRVRILVTGAGGFVGLNIVRILAGRGHDIIALVRSQPDAAIEHFLKSWPEKVQFVTGDVRDRADITDLVRSGGISHIVHGAAVTPAPASERADPVNVIDTNLMGTVNILEAAHRCAVQRVVFISSNGVYGAPQERNERIHENHPLHVSNLYTICKVSSEQLCRRYAELYGLSVVVGRLGAAYGPMERQTASRETMSAIHDLISGAISGRLLTVYGADRQRDYCYINDAAEALSLLLLSDHVAQDVYNVSSGIGYSIRDILDILMRLIPCFRWVPTNDPSRADTAVHPSYERGALDIGRLRNDFGFVPQYSLEAGLSEYLSWIRQWDVRA